MNLVEYQAKALETESVVEQLEASPALLESTFGAFIQLTEILDGIKKQVYYGKSKKLDEKFLSLAEALLESAHQIYDHALRKEYKETEAMPHVRPRLFHGILGMMTEAGELASILHHHMNTPNYELDYVNVQEEMNDSNWYQAIVHDDLELNWEEGLKRNIAKLQEKRYKSGKFTQAEAENRNLEAERQALEGKS